MNPVTGRRLSEAGLTAQAVALVLILLLAAALRFYRLDWTEYKLDEANISRLALDMARTGHVPVWGLGSSVGIYNGALSVWLLAIPYAVSSSPLMATGFVAALNVLAVAMTFAFTRKIAGPTAGLIAALLFAVAPWAVLNSRKLWAQDLLPPFVIGYSWAAYKACVEGKTRWWAVHVLALAACIQLHYSALTLVFLTGFFIVVFWWRRWPWKMLLITLVIGFLAFAPFLYRDATTIARDPVTGQESVFLNITRVVDTVLHRKSVVDATALQMAWIMVTGSDLHSLAGEREFRSYLDSAWPVTPLYVILGVMISVALGWALWWVVRAWDEAQVKAGFIVAMGVVFPVVLFMWHSTPVYPHYFILLYPWPYVLVAMLITWLARRRPQWHVAWWGGAILIVIAVAQVYGFWSILHFVAERNTPSGYGTPVGLLLRVVDSAEQRSREMGNAEIIVQGSSDNLYADNEAAAFDVLLDPRLPRRFVSMTSAAVYPAGNAVFVNRVLPGQSGPVQFALRSGEGGYNLTDWDGKSQLGLSNNLTDPLLTRLASPAAFVNGADVWAFHVYGGRGGELRFRLAWFVGSAPPTGADYHWTNQLFDAEGKRVWQKDDVGLPASNWRIGDLVMTDFAAPLGAEVKPGVYQMRVGMYTYPDIKTVPTTDGQAYVKVGPIEIR